MKAHELKIDPIYFNAHLAGMKTCEIRRNDRKFTQGDTVILREWLNDEFTGRDLPCKLIGWVDTYSQRDGWVVLSLIEKGA